MASRGRFITLEGGEGAGKSTLARALAEALETRGVRIKLTREPGGTPNAEAIRELLVSGDADRWSAVAETLLLYAARVDHVDRLIRPALEAGLWVICDRFADSTRAYQGAGGALPAERIAAIHKASIGDFSPDLTFILDLDPEHGLQRTRARGEAVTRFETRERAFHQALRSGFLAIAEAEPDRCVVLDAARPADELTEEAIAILSERLALG